MGDVRIGEAPSPSLTHGLCSAPRHQAPFRQESLVGYIVGVAAFIARRTSW